MKTKKSLATLLLLALVTMSLVACGPDKHTADDIIGTWEYTTASGASHTYIFSEGGKISLVTSLATSTGTYTVDGDTINYTLNMSTGNTKTDSMTFKLKDDSIDLTINGHTYNYKKK